MKYIKSVGLNELLIFLAGSIYSVPHYDLAKEEIVFNRKYSLL